MTVPLVILVPLALTLGLAAWGDRGRRARGDVPRHWAHGPVDAGGGDGGGGTC